MQVVAHPEVQRHAIGDLPLVLQEEVIRPPPALDRNRRECPRRGRGDAEEKVGVRMAALGNARDGGISIRESRGAEQICVRGGFVVARVADLGSAFERVRSPHVGDLVLHLLGPIQESWIRPVDLRESGQGRSREAHFVDAGDIREVRSESLQTQVIHDLQAVEGSAERIVVVDMSEAQFVHQRRTDYARVRQRHRLVLAELLPLAESGQVAFPDRIGQLRQREAREDPIPSADIVIHPAGEVVRLPGTARQGGVVVARTQDARVSRVRQRIEPILNPQRHRVDRARGDAAVGVDLARKRIANRNTEGGKVTTPPCLEGHRGVQSGRRGAARERLAGCEPERAPATVVHLRHGDRAAGREADVVLHPGAALGREELTRTHVRALVIVEGRAVERVGPRFRDERHLAERRELGAVIREIDLDLL